MKQLTLMIVALLACGEAHAQAITPRDPGPTAPAEEKLFYGYQVYGYLRYCHDARQYISDQQLNLARSQISSIESHLMVEQQDKLFAEAMSDMNGMKMNFQSCQIMTMEMTHAAGGIKIGKDF